MKAAIQVKFEFCGACTYVILFRHPCMNSAFIVSFVRFKITIKFSNIALAKQRKDVKRTRGIFFLGLCTVCIYLGKQWSCVDLGCSRRHRE